MKEITLTRGYVALVDDEDFERVNAFKWYADVHVYKSRTTVYAQRHVRFGGKLTTARMHTFIVGSLNVDHSDGNGLNNQRGNLRHASTSQNIANREKWTGASRFKGVSWNKQAKKWEAYITKNRDRVHIGLFKDEVDAATAYNFAAEELFGEFACMNTVQERIV